MTPEQIEKLAREVIEAGEKATPGMGIDNARFTVLARLAAPKLAEECLRLLKENKKLNDENREFYGPRTKEEADDLANDEWHAGEVAGLDKDKKG